MLCTLPASISQIQIPVCNSMSFCQHNAQAAVAKLESLLTLIACKLTVCCIGKSGIYCLLNPYAPPPPNPPPPLFSHTSCTAMFPTSMPDCADTIETMMGGSNRNPYNIFLLGIGPMINASLGIAVFTGFAEQGAWGSWAKTLVESWKNSGIEVRQCTESHDNL